MQILLATSVRVNNSIQQLLRQPILLRADFTEKNSNINPLNTIDNENGAFTWKKVLFTSTTIPTAQLINAIACDKKIN